MATKTTALAAALLLAAAGAARADYATVWLYQNAACTNPAQGGLFTWNATCTPQACEGVTEDFVASGDLTCATSHDGIVPANKGKFLVLEYFENSACSAGTDSAGIMYTSDICSDIGDGDYVFAGCTSDGTVTFKLCKNSACTLQCESFSTTAHECMESGASESMTAYCSAATTVSISWSGLAAAAAATASVVLALAG